MIELTPEQERFVSEQIAHGSFSTPDEVIQAAVELFKERMEQREYDDVVASAKKGMDEYRAGGGRPMDEVFDEVHERLDLPK